MSTPYETAKRALESRSDLIRGTGATAIQIDDAQAQLGQFPEEFKRFLADFSYAAFNGEQIWGFPPADSPLTALVPMNVVERRDFDLPDNLVAFQNDGGGDLVCFRAGAKLGESILIWSQDQQRAFLQASTFADYLMYLHTDDVGYLS